MTPNVLPESVKLVSFQCSLCVYDAETSDLVCETYSFITRSVIFLFREIKPHSPCSEATAPVLKLSRLTLMGRLGLAGGGPKARLLGRGLRLGPEASSLTLLPGERFRGFFRLGFLLGSGFGGGTALATPGGGLLAQSALPSLSGSLFELL